jgi:hypothetical protein
MKKTKNNTKKIKVKVIDVIPRYAEIGDIGIIEDDYKEQFGGRRMRGVRFKDDSYLIFGDEAFKKMLEIQK